MIQPAQQAAVVLGGIVFGAAVIDSNSTVTVGCAVAVIGATVGGAWWSGRKWQSFLDHQKSLEKGVSEQAKRLERVELKINSYERQFSELDRKIEDLGLARKVDIDRLRLELVNGTQADRHDPKPSILIVDDEINDRRLFKRGMSQLYDVDEASSLREGIEKALAKRYDCVVIDLYLPDSSPTETVAQFVKDNPMAVCVAFSGTQSEEHINAALKSGADSFIAKSHITDSKYISRMIQVAIERKKME